MEIKIDITPEKIDEMVRKNLVEAAIGQSIIKEVQECLKAGSYNSPIKLGVQKLINRLVEEVLDQPENQAIVREAVLKVVTVDVMREVSENAVKKLQDKARSDY